MWSASYQRHCCRKNCDPLLNSCGKPNTKTYQMAAWERHVDRAGRMKIRRAFLKSIYSFADSHCEWCCIDIIWLQLLKISAESRSCVLPGSLESSHHLGERRSDCSCLWQGVLLPKKRAGQGMAAAHCLWINVSYGVCCAALDSQTVVKKSWQPLPKIPPADEDGSFFCWQPMAARGGFTGCQKLYFILKPMDLFRSHMELLWFESRNCTCMAHQLLDSVVSAHGWRWHYKTQSSGSKHWHGDHWWHKVHCFSRGCMCCLKREMLPLPYLYSLTPYHVLLLLLLCWLWYLGKSVWDPRYIHILNTSAKTENTS